MHRTLRVKPYIFSRRLETGDRVDRVLVAMDQGEGAKSIPFFGVFPDGTKLVDAYSGVSSTVRNGGVSLTTGSSLILLAEPR